MHITFKHTFWHFSIRFGVHRPLCW